MAPSPAAAAARASTRRTSSGLRASSAPRAGSGTVDRKSTRLNSSHDQISYAVFCLKKKKKTSTALLAVTAIDTQSQNLHPADYNRLRNARHAHRSLCALADMECQQYHALRRQQHMT